MIRLAANLSLLFTELPLLDRFEAAARAGFRAVELTFPYEQPTHVLATHLRENDLRLVLINTPPGDASAGELGLAVLPGRQADTAAVFRRALEYAVALEVPLIHFLAGRIAPHTNRAMRDTLFLENIAYAADLAAPENIVLTLEPLNERDRPDYHLHTTSHAREVIERSCRRNVKLQFDFYHSEISEGDSLRSLERHIDVIAHVQIAGVPGRAEPSRSELDCTSALSRLDTLGYRGYVGCEYHPAADTLGGLGWAASYLAQDAKNTDVVRQ